MGLDTFLLKWPEMRLSFAQKINDLRNKEFKGHYPSKRDTQPLSDQPKSKIPKYAPKAGSTSTTATTSASTSALNLEDGTELNFDLDDGNLLTIN